jgi:Predicted periplasmic or secreted lipoprotein
LPLTGKELAKLAINNGWEEVRVRGSHHHFKKDGVSYIVTIPIHGNKVLKIGLEKKLLRDLNLL